MEKLLDSDILPHKWRIGHDSKQEKRLIAARVSKRTGGSRLQIIDRFAALVMCQISNLTVWENVGHLPCRNRSIG